MTLTVPQMTIIILSAFMHHLLNVSLTTSTTYDLGPSATIEDLKLFSGLLAKMIRKEISCHLVQTSQISTLG